MRFGTAFFDNVEKETLRVRRETEHVAVEVVDMESSSEDNE